MQLYINKIKADLNPDEQLPKFTYQVADYQRPAVVKNNFSTDITLPSSPNNDSIFECSFLLDRINLNFNPSKRLEFVLYDDGGEILESGYVKLTKVNRDDKTHSYTITLFGALGNWLYNLSYDGKGEKLTLADLDYGVDLGFTINKELVNDAWSKIGSEAYPIWSTINFAPLYDGVPSAENFDPSRVAIYTESYADTSFRVDDVIVKGLPTSKNGYYTKNGWGALSARQDLTAFETLDFRSYLLRPILKVSAIIDAIERTSGFTIEKEGRFFNSDYDSLWMTLLPLYKIKKDVKTGDVFSKNDILSQTDTPAEYLLSLLKTYGIYIELSPIEKKVKLIQRDLFYKDEVIPIVACSPGEINPLNFDNKYFELKFKENGSGIETDYKDKYGSEYGRQLIDTGYDFNKETKDVISGNVLANAADSIGQSRFYGKNTNDNTTWYPPEITNIGGWSGCDWILFGDGESVSLVRPIVAVSGWNGRYSLRADWTGLPSATRTGAVVLDAFPKVNLADKEGKFIDGKNVLISYRGKVVPGVYTYAGGIFTKRRNVPYILSDDLDVAVGSEGKQCWIDTDGKANDHVIVLNGIPSFTRARFDYSKPTYIQHPEGDFGNPKEIYTSRGVTFSPEPTGTIYERYWKSYINDIYNANTRVLKIKVKASSIIRGEIKECFRSFYSFENALWALQKINNYTPGDELVDCEFVKVNDKANYKK